MKKNNFNILITPERNLFSFNIKEIISFKDLIWLFVKRDFKTFYVQTILGPIWYIIQPLINTLIFTIIFGKLANISTDGVSPFLFYLSGTIVWGYFANNVNLTSDTFTKNSELFGKVYFPRIIVPIANILVNFAQFIIQFLIFVLFYIYFNLNYELFQLNYLELLFLPLILLQLALLSLGVGTLISSITSKYKDLTLALSFIVQAWMYATPIVYPLSVVPEKYKIFFALNPMTSIVECFRLIFLGVSSINIYLISVSLVTTLVIFIFGVLSFNKTEKNFMDTV